MSERRVSLSGDMLALGAGTTVGGGLPRWAMPVPYAKGTTRVPDLGSIDISYWGE